MQQRTALELVAEELRSHLNLSKPGDVFAWGSGANYQLGTGSAQIHELPQRVDALEDCTVVALAAAKYHSCAATAKGQLLTWGWGRGGRLGHADFEVDSKQKIMAQIQPRAVAGLSRVKITAVAAAKHHTIACGADGRVCAPVSISAPFSLPCAAT